MLQLMMVGEPVRGVKGADISAPLTALTHSPTNTNTMPFTTTYICTESDTFTLNRQL